MASYFTEGETKLGSQNEKKGVKGLINKMRLIIQAINDKIQFYTKRRWITICFLCSIYFLRLIITRGYQALTYCIGIHFLNSFIGFISPMIDPEGDEFDEENKSYLPQNNSQEFRPFQRKVKEYHLWQAIFLTLLVGNIMTFFPALDVPVFWPLLLIYFLMIFFITMRNQIAHMMKYNYLPWDIGKIQYSHTKLPRTDPDLPSQG